MSNNKDTLGDRIKRYESVSKPLLTRRSPVMVRVDGKAFHTFTRGCNKPYDNTLIDAMVYATEKTAREMQGFELAYTQSDEATFMLWDFRTTEQGAWFDYELNKIVSITASLFTAHFNNYWSNSRNVFNGDKGHDKIALFDARAFNVPYDDWPNAFIWRQRDWERNSVQMMARSLFSQKQLHGEDMPGLHQMIQGAGLDWHNLEPQLKYGTFIDQNYEQHYMRINYELLRMVEGWEQ